VSSSAPGPGIGVIAHLPRLRRDPLGTMLAWHREYGDVVRLGDGPLTVHLLGHPRHAEHVLRRRHMAYDRQTRSAGAVRIVTGESLLTNDGEQWKRHRLLLQPLFNNYLNKDAPGSLEAIVKEATHAMIDDWLARGEVDIAAEMTRLTSTIASRAFFGIDLDEELARLMPVILEETYARATSVFGWGRPSRTFEEACTEVRAVVERIVARGDSPLLELLRELPADELRNEALALLLAGQDTTANALAWTFALIREDDDPAAAVQEAMRLYPPVWIVERRAVEDDEIDGFEIPADSYVYVSPYVLHRHQEFWSDPERFDPRRFPNSGRNLAYLPFGCGPHACLGAAFAMFESPLVVTIVRERCTISVKKERIEPKAWVTLRPRDGVSARIVAKR
jgi:cytochrome P450